MNANETETIQKQKHYVESLRRGPLYFNADLYSKYQSTLSKDKTYSKSKERESKYQTQNLPRLLNVRNLDLEDLRREFLGNRYGKKRFGNTLVVKDGPTLDKMRLLWKAFTQLRYNFEDNKKLAQALFKRRTTKKVLHNLRDTVKRIKKLKRQNRNIRKLCRLFQLKTILREWKKTNATVLKSKQGKAKKEILNFCVKYSDYCKCLKCEHEREKRADIVPVRDEYQQRKRASMRIFETVKTKDSTRVIPFNELYKDEDNWDHKKSIGAFTVQSFMGNTQRYAETMDTNRQLTTNRKTDHSNNSHIFVESLSID